jgi:ABC-type multidrug transport system ATPase subunit
MSEKIIEIKSIAKKFGLFEAVKDVSFHVNQGDVFGFLGPNGAGKSTTIRCMLSLIKPDAGSIEIFGKSIFTHRNEILSRTGSIIEKPDFYKYLSAYKNLEIFSRLSRVSVGKQEIYNMLDFVGLGGREKDKFAGFSHGMKQRLGIAQTLLHNPDLIVLDEPTTGLDPQGIIDIRNLILRLKNEQHKTVILSSHNLAEIEIICNRMVIINKGISVVEGEVKALMNNEDLVVRLELSDKNKAKALILAQYPNMLITDINETNIELPIEKSMISELNKNLVQAGIGVFFFFFKRKLEDYFIKMVNA